MLTRPFLSLWLPACAALALVAGIILWALAQSGTAGLWSWGWAKVFIILGIVGILPMLLALAAALSGPAKAAPVLTILVWISSALAAAAFTAILCLFTLPALSPLRWQGSLNLVDPARGLQAFARPTTNPDVPATPSSPSTEIAALTFLVSSDPHFDKEGAAHDQTAAILTNAERDWRAGRLDGLFILGDFVEYGHQLSGWQQTLDTLARLAPTIPLLAIRGNHDSIVGGQAHWEEAFAPGRTRPRDFTGQRGQSPSLSSWHMTLPLVGSTHSPAPAVHFIALDLLWGTEGFGPRHQAWLDAELSAIPDQDWVIVLSHCFFHASGYTDSTGNWFDHPHMLATVAPLLEGRADLVISGHNHYMEWLETPGTRWAIIGAMGGIPDPEPTYRSPASRWLRQGTHGALRLTIRPDTLHCTFQDSTGTPLYETAIPRR